MDTLPSGPQCHFYSVWLLLRLVWWWNWSSWLGSSSRSLDVGQPLPLQDIWWCGSVLGTFFEMEWTSACISGMFATLIDKGISIDMTDLFQWKVFECSRQMTFVQLMLPYCGDARRRVLSTHQHVISDTKCDSNSPTRVHRVFTDMEHPRRCWLRDRLEIIASRWHSCAWAIFRCWRPICTVSGVETPHLSTLQWCWRDGVTLPSTRPGTAGVVAQPPLPKWPKMPVELLWADWGSEPSSRPGMRETERRSCMMGLCDWYSWTK